MKTWITKFEAINTKTQRLETFAGPAIKGATYWDAQRWCYENAAHLQVVGELIATDGHESSYEAQNN